LLRSNPHQQSTPTLENGAAIGTANIGREGAFGLFAAMYSRVSFNPV